MKYITFAILFFMPYFSDLFSQNYKEWIPGEYSTYHTEWKDGRWEAYQFIVNKKNPDDTWEIDAFFKSENIDIILRFNALDKSSKDKAPAELVGYKKIRGNDPDNQFISSLYVKFLNLLNTRFFDTEAKNAQEVNSTICCNLGKSIEIEDKWDEFKYSLYHSLNHSVPILGIVRTRKIPEDFTMFLTSFGRNTLNYSSYKTYPTFIDTYTMKTIQHDGFSLTYPSSWILNKITNSTEKNKEIWMTSLGGNIHAGYLIISIATDSKEINMDNFKKFMTSKGEMVKKKSNEFTFQEDLSDRKHKLFLFDFKIEGQIGKKLVWSGINSDRTKVAEINLFTNFGSDNPHQDSLPGLIQKFASIVKSFQFTDLGTTSNLSKEGNGSCSISIKWFSEDTLNKGNTDLFGKFCKNLSGQNCKSLKNAEFTSGKSCKEIGFTSKCLFHGDTYLLKNMDGCPK